LSESPILAATEEKQSLFLGTEYFIRAQARLEMDFFLGAFSPLEENNL
jgi:hypothetical protein